MTLCGAVLCSCGNPRMQLKVSTDCSLGARLQALVPGAFICPSIYSPVYLCISQYRMCVCVCTHMCEFKNSNVIVPSTVDST